MPRRKQPPPGEEVAPAPSTVSPEEERPVSRAQSDATTAASSQTEEPAGVSQAGSENEGGGDELMSDGESVVPPSTASCSTARSGDDSDNEKIGSEEGTEAETGSQTGGPEQGSSTTRERVLRIRDEMLVIYREHNPRKVHNIDELLAQWEGDEEELLTSIRAKYGVEAPPDADRCVSTSTLITWVGCMGYAIANLYWC